MDLSRYCRAPTNTGLVKSGNAASANFEEATGQEKYQSVRRKTKRVFRITWRGTEVVDMDATCVLPEREVCDTPYNPPDGITRKGVPDDMVNRRLISDYLVRNAIEVLGETIVMSLRRKRILGMRVNASFEY